jgi:hypothetical protein
MQPPFGLYYAFGSNSHRNRGNIRNICFYFGPVVMVVCWRGPKIPKRYKIKKSQCLRHHVVPLGSTHLKLKQTLAPLFHHRHRRQMDNCWVFTSERVGATVISIRWEVAQHDSITIVNECLMWVWWNGATTGSAIATYLLFLSCLIVVSVPNSLGTRPGRLVCSNQSIAIWFDNNSKRMFSVSLVEWCNNISSNRDIPVIR